MKILSVILSLILLAVRPPQSPQCYWDAVIDSYEQLCEACSDSKDHALVMKLKQEFDSLLQHPVGKMNQSQKKRFDALRSRYSAVAPVQVLQKTDTVVLIKQPVIEKVREIEHVTVIDTVKRTENVNILKVENVFNTKDTMVVIHEYRAPSVKTSRAPSERTRKPVHLLLGATAAFVPDFSIGGVIGLGGNCFGGYVKARSNFRETGYDYEYASALSGLWTSGNQTVSRTLLTAGAYFKVAGRFGMYAGAGYGENGLYFQDVDGRWVRLSDYSGRGASFDLGAFYSTGKVRFLLGVSTTSFRYFDAEAGMGIVLF